MSGDDPRIGKRVKLIRCTDEWTKLEPGAQGTITFVDSMGTVHVEWDDGHRLGLVPGQDQWEFVRHIVGYTEDREHKGDYWARCTCGWDSGREVLRWDAICRMVDAHKATMRQGELFKDNEPDEQLRLRRTETMEKPNGL